MRRALLFAALAACGSPTEAPPQPAAAPAAEAVDNAAGKPHHREDRHDPQARPATLSLAIATGTEKSTWGAPQLAAVPKLAGTASDGEARDTWDLRALARTNAGPTARVAAVVGETRYEISAADWADASKVPVLHTTRRGTLKFRWADPSGKWGETVVKEVTGLELAKQ